QLFHLALRLAAEAAEKLLVRVSGTCQGNPLLSGRSWSPAARQKLKGGDKSVVGRSYGAWTLVPPRGRGLARVGGRGGRVGGMPAEGEIARVSASEYEEVLSLIAAYQRFYEGEDVDEERNRAFFRRFLAPSDEGLLLGARAEGRLVGHACLYWHK